MEARFDCFMIHHIVISEDMATSLCAVAADMIRDRKTVQRAKGDGFDCLITTAFARKTAEFSEEGVLVRGYLFHALINLGTRSGRICFLVPTDPTPVESLNIAVVELEEEPGEEEQTCILCPSGPGLVVPSSLN